ncbi:hypothetical protein BJF78_17370 [Pseudonocardia sp. CNS-139]|nr:hypothetical protein BJF78_17370 [Pseudonocardia sp. CNS-139]
MALVEDYQAEFATILRAGQRTGVVWDGDPAVLGALSFGALVGLTKLARASGVGIDAFDLLMVERAVGAVLGMPAPEPR